MNVFHHGGRLGDCVYALYTVKNLGGGKIFISDFHQGDWNRKLIDLLLPFLKYQAYIKDAEFIKYQNIEPLLPKMFDLHKGETDYNPEMFPEYNGKGWPANAHIGKRYALHFGLEFDFESIWITAPKTKKLDIAFHAPERRLIPETTNRLKKILKILGTKYDIICIGDDADLKFWNNTPNIKLVKPDNMLEASDYINSASIFLGAVSSCACIAEGLKKRRLVWANEDCFNTYHKGDTGKYLNFLSDEEAIKYIKWEC